MGISGSQPALMQNRAGIARAGATRANYYTSFNVALTINGTNRSSALAKDPGMRIAQVLNDEPDTASFTLLPQGLSVSAGQLVVIGLGAISNREFAGQIVSFTRRFERGITNPFLDVNCIDWARLLDRRVVDTEYTNVSATAIARDLMDSWTAGFTRFSVVSGLPTIDFFPVTNETVSSALRRLANLIGGAFYFDAYRDLHFFGSAGDTTARAGTNPLQLTSSRSTLKAFQYTSEVSQVRTRVFVEGKSTTAPIGVAAGSTSFPMLDATGWTTGAAGVARLGTQRFTYNNLLAPSVGIGANLPGPTYMRSAAIAGATSLDFDNNNVLLGVAPTWIYISGQALLVTAISLDNHTVTIPTSGVGSLNTNLNVNDQVYLLPYFTGIPNSGIGSIRADQPLSSSVVMLAQVDDATAQATVAAIEGGDGIHERVVPDNRLNAVGATDRGNGELDTFSGEIITAEWETEDLNARPGRQQSVNFGGLSTTLLITRSEIYFPRPNATPRRRCEASSVRQAGLMDAVVRSAT